MNILKKTLTAEQAREAYRQKRLERAREDPDPTEPMPELDDGLPPIPGDDRYLWPSAIWGQDLTFRVPASAPLLGGGLEQISFLLGASVLHTRVLQDPENDPTEREYTVSAALIESEGRYALSYEHKNFVGNDEKSFPLMLYVDHTPPNKDLVGDKPDLPREIIDNGLELDYLNTHPSVDVSIPRSSDIVAGDVIEVYWTPIALRQDPDPWFVVARHTVTEQDASPTPGGPIVVAILSDDIKSFQDGHIAISYRYIDRTGNLGQPSEWSDIYVDLDPLPETLVDPQVPLADDGLIDRADAREGVVVLIPDPGYENQKPAEDKIEVIWEEVAVTPVPVSTFPMYIPIDWPTLSRGGATTKRGFKVRYNVLRGLKRTPSEEIDIEVDFTVAGVDPDPDPDPAGPDPINNKLPRVVIKSREVPPVDNVLGEADKGVDATAQIPSNPVTAGQTLRLYWGFLKPHVDEVTITTEQSTDPIDFTIPWIEIQKGGYNDKLPVYYTTDNGVNEQESARTEVDVRIVELSLDDVVFPDQWLDNTGPVPIINCCSVPWNGIKVQVQGDPVNFAIGDTLAVSWQAYSDMTGVTEIPATDYAFPPETFDQDKVDNGFPLTVPYADYVEPIVTHGSGRVTCTLTKASGQSGSHVTLVIVTRMSGTGLCSPQFPSNCH